MLQIILYIFKLPVALDIVQRGVVLSGSAQVDHSEIPEQLIQVLPDSFIDGLGPLAASHDHKDRLSGIRNNVGSNLRSNLRNDLRNNPGNIFRGVGACSGGRL